MKPIPDDIQVKLAHADDFCSKIKFVCVKQIISPSDRRLMDIGAYLGDMANNLRSALNYAMRDFVENNLKSALSLKEYKTIQKMDFPYSAANKADFDGKTGVKHIFNHFPVIYQFLEAVQPYRNDCSWLGYLMGMSNTDKHITINMIVNRNIVDAVVPGGFRAEIVGDTVMMSNQDGSSVEFHKTPYYVRPYQMFAAKEGEWILFIANSKKQRLGLIYFVEDTPKKVNKIISDFYSLI